MLEVQPFLQPQLASLKEKTLSQL